MVVFVLLQRLSGIKQLATRIQQQLYFFKKNPGIFRFATLLLEIPDIPSFTFHKYLLCYTPWKFHQGKRNKDLLPQPGNSTLTFWMIITIQLLDQDSANIILHVLEFHSTLTKKRFLSQNGTQNPPPPMYRAYLLSQPEPACQQVQ